MGACDGCMRRTWLLERVSSYLEFQRRRCEAILGIADLGLIDLAERRLNINVHDEYLAFGADEAERERLKAAAAGVELLCACDSEYPYPLLALGSTRPAVLHVAGGMRRFLELARADPVAIVGARQATEYGTAAARMLGRGLSASGLTVVSGLAIGVDVAAHEGALAAGSQTIAVLAGSAAEANPKVNRHVYARIRRDAAVVSELGPHAASRRWAFVARNRIIAALSKLTVVVQARDRSGTEGTVQIARALGRSVGAVPGSVLSRLSDGPNSLLAEGVSVIRGPQDVLDTIFGVGVRAAQEQTRRALDQVQLAVLDAVAGGADTLASLGRLDALAAPGHSSTDGEHLMTTLAGLELAGFIRRTTGGRYTVVL
jgi:DNA processing protein